MNEEEVTIEDMQTLFDFDVTESGNFMLTQVLDAVFSDDDAAMNFIMTLRENYPDVWEETSVDLYPEPDGSEEVAAITPIGLVKLVFLLPINDYTMDGAEQFIRNIRHNVTVLSLAGAVNELDQVAEEEEEVPGEPEDYDGDEPSLNQVILTFIE